LVNLNYSVYDYQKYLSNIIENNLKIEYSINTNNDNTVKIMTIHASKGLEFNICYFSCLYSKFNIREATNKFTYDNKYGIILPYKDDFIFNTIYHTLSYKNYVLENISERIRLFYVALTRAKEKMIFILPQNPKEETIDINDIIDINIRKKYNSFASIMYSLETITKNNYKNISLDDIHLTKEYNLIKNNNYKKEINYTDEKIFAEETKIENKSTEEKRFSKNNSHLINKEEQSKLDYGLKLHELLELTDFKNINNKELSTKEKEIINNFINLIDINNAQIYKEYEFVFEEENTTYHGIIDLMLEYNNHIKIIDYKLKNTNDTEYLKQLKGYQNYIEKTFDKKVTIYLYSILDNKIKEI